MSIKSQTPLIHLKTFLKNKKLKIEYLLTVYITSESSFSLPPHIEFIYSIFLTSQERLNWW